MILLIDNYDSFAYNLYQLIGKINPDIKVIRNDELSVKEIEDLNPSHIIISPGPGTPDAAGICEDVIEKLAPSIPILGICLGHQAICEVYGAKVTYAKELMHGKQSQIDILSYANIFRNIKNKTKVARYHSLAATRESIPDCLEVLALSDDQEVMAVKHKKYEVYGLQFHPESILSEDGEEMLRNFFGLYKTEKYQKENNNMIETAIKKLSKKENLTYEEAFICMNEIMQGKVDEVKLAAFLVALSMKGETIDEISAFATSMREHSLKLEFNEDLLEIVGTGGDNSNSFNISTATSLVVAATGVKVAKHGNRAASSKSGTADCLEALGVNINLSPKQSKEVLKKVGICFLFAQKYHPSMKYVAKVRKELGIRTVFNILGPLTNPAKANMQLLGVYASKLVEPMAMALKNLGLKRAMVVHGKDGLDEISLSSSTKVCEFDEKGFREYILNPNDYGLDVCKKEDLVGGDANENAKILRGILEGEKGHRLNVVLLNAAAALVVANKVANIKDGIKLAKESIESGKALKKLEEFIRISNEVEDDIR